jgi:hypothetical protein
MTDRQNEAPSQNGALPPRPEPPPNIELRPGVKIPMPKPLADYGYIRRP